MLPSAAEIKNRPRLPLNYQPEEPSPKAVKIDYSFILRNHCAIIVKFSTSKDDDLCVEGMI